MKSEEGKRKKGKGIETKEERNANKGRGSAYEERRREEMQRERR